MSSSAPFKVKAIYEYKSLHEDDLNFPVNQIINVTEEEDADWYIGEFTDPSGEQKSGLFPKNFVERYEPVAPPRPTRASRPKQAEVAPAPVEQPPASQSIATQNSQGAEAGDEELPPAIEKNEPLAAVENRPEPSPAPQPVSSAPSGAKKAPPPVAEKPSSFRDRIAAFNKQAAAPIAPFKPGAGSAPNTFIKKPFVAPPPARDAYVPPPREAAPAKTYRRDEDPEIAERQQQDQDDAERAGLAITGETGGEDAPKAVSLKERIALLQKQQMEQAARRAEHTHKEKPKRPPKKRTESHEDQEAVARDSFDTESGDAAARGSVDSSRAVSARQPLKTPRSSEEPNKERDLFSDTNDADQSAGGETTEDAEGGETSLEEEERKVQAKAHAASRHEPDIGDEEDESGEANEQEEAEEELDEETRRQVALRERMAKLSGGMGMGVMFGPPGGLAMPGMGGAQKKMKLAPAPEHRNDDSGEEAPTLSAQRMPMVPIPGMGRTMSFESTGPSAAAKRTEDHPITGAYPPEEVVDVEDVKPMSPRSERTVPPIPAQERAAPAPRTPTDRAPPPIPSDRPKAPEGRAVPPPPTTQGETEGSESDDEIMDSAVPPFSQRDQAGFFAQGQSDPRSLPPVPPRDLGQSSSASTQVPEKRASRAPPPIPVGSPTTSSPSSAARGPPPLPPGALPTRSPTSDSLQKRAVTGAGESDYEGDYDTDIASSAKHKGALKSHTREESLDDSIAAGETPLRSPQLTSPTGFIPSIPGGVPLPSTIHRAAPPPPPGQPPLRRSTEAPRGPPPVPSSGSPDDNDDYDPYRYTQLVSSPPPASRAIPQAPQAPPPLPSQPPRQITSDEMDADEDEDLEETEQEQYESPPPRKSAERAAPPLPPQVPPHSNAPPPPPPAQQPPRVQQPTALPRHSTDYERPVAPQTRKSVEQPRPSLQGDQGFIARDVDLGHGSMWWTQPNMPPPAFQNRRDVLYEMEENSSSRRGGHLSVMRDVYVLFQDYSQTIVTARFDSKTPQEASLEQRHEPPPAKLRQDELENAYSSYSAQVANQIKGLENNVVGDGAPQALIFEALSKVKDVLMPVGSRSFGALIYANLANATVQQFDEIRPGDIVSFRNAKFQGKHGAMHAKYSTEAGKPDHVGIVADWDGTKKKLRVLEQGREGKKAKVESFRLGDLRSGEVRVWRLMPRAWVGWEGNA